MKTSIREQLREVTREIGLRQGVYKGMVASGRMKQEEADYKIAVMNDVAETLRGLLPPQDTQAELL